MSDQPTGRVEASALPTYIPRVASPEADLVAALGVALTTYKGCIRNGRGPRRFKIGKRWFVRHDDWDKWVLGLAETGGLSVTHSERGARPGRHVLTNEASSYRIGKKND